jgi:murein DD-endopeptidase MepM/ murein hydrolase activator NlpD
MGQGAGRIEVLADDGTTSYILGHVSTAALQPGDRVAAGNLIGTIGSYNGSHVHLEKRQGNSSDYVITDPLTMEGAMTTDLPLDYEAKIAGSKAIPPAQPRSTPGFTPASSDPYEPLIQSAADQYGVPQGILYGLINQESRFDRNALSPAGARGIAQFMPDTAAGMGIDPDDPTQAIPAAAQYLKQHYDAFGSWELALAAYNAGPDNVQAYGGIPPFPETQKYVATIMGNAGL